MNLQSRVRLGAVLLCNLALGCSEGPTGPDAGEPVTIALQGTVTRVSGEPPFEVAPDDQIDVEFSYLVELAEGHPTREGQAFFRFPEGAGNSVTYRIGGTSRVLPMDQLHIADDSVYGDVLYLSSLIPGGPETPVVSTRLADSAAPYDLIDDNGIPDGPGDMDFTMVNESHGAISVFRQEGTTWSVSFDIETGQVGRASRPN